mmetsp:Transcript_119103/g.273130  ORF Transcript_119103/g.273130 Transcript_119103/m.273130 type:complete len:207 (-) Transcript_119103:1828-2448(-)
METRVVIWQTSRPSPFSEITSHVSSGTKSLFASQSAGLPRHASAARQRQSVGHRQLLARFLLAPWVVEITSLASQGLARLVTNAAGKSPTGLAAVQASTLGHPQTLLDVRHIPARESLANPVRWFVPSSTGARQIPDLVEARAAPHFASRPRRRSGAGGVITAIGDPRGTAARGRHACPIHELATVACQVTQRGEPLLARQRTGPI